MSNFFRPQIHPKVEFVVPVLVHAGETHQHSVTGNLNDGRYPVTLGLED